MRTSRWKEERLELLCWVRHEGLSVSDTCHGMSRLRFRSMSEFCAVGVNYYIIMREVQITNNEIHASSVSPPSIFSSQPTPIL